MRAKQGVKSEAILRSEKFVCIADLTHLHVVIKASRVANTSLRWQIVYSSGAYISLKGMFYMITMYIYYMLISISLQNKFAQQFVIVMPKIAV